MNPCLFMLLSIRASFFSEDLHSDRNLETKDSHRKGFFRKNVCRRWAKNAQNEALLFFYNFFYFLLEIT